MSYQLCAICGVEEATTSDHLPPKGIYPTPIDSDINLHTVPACISCNGGASKEDEEFKVFIGLETGEFRGNQKSLLNSLSKTIVHNKRLGTQIFSSSRRIYAKYRGPIAEKVVSIEFDSVNYNSVISRIVRGLYWRETGKALGVSPEITVFPANQLNSEQVTSYKKLMNMLQAKSLNKNTFVYKCIIDTDGSSIWGMQLFKRHTVFAITEKIDNEKL